MVLTLMLYNNNLFAFLIFPIRATCSAYTILLYLSIVILFDEEHPQIMELFIMQFLSSILSFVPYYIQTGMLSSAFRSQTPQFVFFT
jgi:hypothetical protein